MARATLTLPATSGTTVLAWTPLITQSAVLYSSVAVVGSNTAVSLTAAWTDPTVGATTYAFYTNQTLTAPSVNPQVPLMLVAQAGQPVTITAAAATADTVTVTLDLWAREP